MKKGWKKIFTVVFFCFLVLPVVFLFLPASKIFAAKLEVDYPTLITGAKVDSNTDLPNYLKYIFDAGIFLGFFSVFLSLVWAGVLYLLSPAMPNALGDAKDRVSGAISGLLILATLYLIMTTINPALAIFKLNKLDPIPPQPDPLTAAGAYFYNSPDCSGNSSPQTSSSPNLGGLKNIINSVNIVQHPGENLYYVAVLYDLINYSGMCQYINPNNGCQSVIPFADSASVYQYDQSPNGDGVYFYRKSFFNEDGGWMKIPNYNIASEKILIRKLENLQFQDSSSNEPDGCTVPKEEQDCVLWDDKGVCAKKKCPNLAGENITSIKIKGDYAVLLIYFDETKDQKYGTWSSCQAFPTKDDLTKNGPNQVKWENIRNINTGNLPNYMAIIPVKQK